MLFDDRSRLLLIAPHPDDEALGCSVLLQQAVRAGASVRVIYATDGDNNPWPQRVLERKWRISSSDRRRWGKVRRLEALAALKVIGISSADVVFLGLPDQGLTSLLCGGSCPAVDQFGEIVRQWAPTHLIVPSISDVHPDHSAVAVILRLAIGQAHEASTYSYLVHGRSRRFFRQAAPLTSSAGERQVKLAAILCHKTQTKLSRRRFLGYAARPERFLAEDRTETICDGAIVNLFRHGDLLHVQIRLSLKPIRSRDTGLFLIGRDFAENPLCFVASLPNRSSDFEMSNCGRGCALPARYSGNAFTGTFTVAVDSFSPGHPLFIKLQRRSLFFDEAGWIEAPALRTPGQVGSLQHTKEIARLR